MTPTKHLTLALLFAAGFALPARAESPKGGVTTDSQSGIDSPRSVSTRLGTLKFSNGSPDQRTSEKLFDNLDFQRAVHAYLLALPPVSMVAIRDGLTQWGPANSTIPIFETLTDSRYLPLTTNRNTPYTWLWLNLRQGPVVTEIPSRAMGMVNDFWFHTVAEIGFTGPDKGEGGKYLILPPGYARRVPKGYFVVKATTFEGFLGWRNFVDESNPTVAKDNLRESTRVYPLSEAANPHPNKFVSVSGQAFNTIAPADYKFWEYLNQVVQGEPRASLDPVASAYYASIGIEKGKPFTPDVRMKKILTEAAAVGDATARAIAANARKHDAYYFPPSFSIAWPPAALPPWR